MIAAFTGHRPNKFLNGYSEQVATELYKFAKTVIRHHEPREIISGMALGWDQAVAHAGISLGVPVHAYMPFEGQDSVWPQQSKDRYQSILKRCKTVQIISSGSYSVDKMQIRNEAMVNDCDILIALWDGSDGGTANCVNYARRRQKRLKAPEIFNEWSLWQVFQQAQR